MERELDERRREEAHALQELRATREKETYQHESLFGTYSGTARDIAIRVRTERDKYQWLPSNPAPDQSSPLSDDEATELLHLLRDIAPDDERDIRKTALGLNDAYCCLLNSRCQIAQAPASVISFAMCGPSSTELSRQRPVVVPAARAVPPFGAPRVSAASPLGRTRRYRAASHETAPEGAPAVAGERSSPTRRYGRLQR